MVVWKPERRNRNIGTKSSGHSKSNDMRIPESWRDRRGIFSPYYQRLKTTRVEEIVFDDFLLRILYEEPHQGFSHGCSPADVAKLLKVAAKTVQALPDAVAFRQPTRKQHAQNPVWGRFIYDAEFGKYRGTAIVLEAQELGAFLRWPKSMSLDDRAEFERLIDDGHSFVETKRHFQACLTEDGIRNTKLYRTLLHELGHMADYQEKVVNRATALDPDQDIAAELYFSKPTSEREIFAHSFAERLRQTLMRSGDIPFEPQPFT